MTDPRKILLCSFCFTLASSVEEGNKVSCTVQVFKKNEGDILGYPSKKIILGQSVWDIKHLNDRMHGISYIWQSQAPVSINSCLTIEGLLKKCISEEVPRGFFLRPVIVNRGNSCKLKPRKNVLVFRQWADLFQFSKFRNVKWTSLFLFGFCTKMIFANEWSNARNGIYMTKSRTSFNKKLLNYWIFLKGMYHWRGSLCLSSSDGHHEQGKFMRIESEKR